MSLLAENPPTFYAEKRWRRGRIAQLRRRLHCLRHGHEFGRFREGVRVCANGCGGCTRRGDLCCSECGTWSLSLEGSWFGDLTGWVLGRGYVLCPWCASRETSDT